MNELGRKHSKRAFKHRKNSKVTGHGDAKGEFRGIANDCVDEAECKVNEGRASHVMLRNWNMFQRQWQLKVFSFLLFFSNQSTMKDGFGKIILEL